MKIRCNGIKMATIKYDIVVYGATGFTGSLVAQYLATHPQQPSLALAGRNEEKVRGVLAKLTDVSKERAESIGVVRAESGDKASLQHMARSATVIINMVGPYMAYGGLDVASAAVEAGAGYVDLSGESVFYRELITRLHERARTTGAILVPSMGFGSAPFDLSTYLAVQQVKRTAGPSAEIDYALCGFIVQGRASGGTVASIVDQRKYPDMVRFTQPYFLSPIKGQQVAKVVRSIDLPQWGKKGAFTLFSPHNTRIVSRTWGLLQEAGAPQQYGAAFRYLEGMACPSSIVAVILSTAMLVVAWLIINVYAFGNMLVRLIPQGTGAPMEEQLKGYGVLRTIAYQKNGSAKALTSIAINGDPGYVRTAPMISEVALTIALERARLPPLAQGGGVLTAATLGGEVYAERLMKYGKFEIATADVSDVKDVSSVLPNHVRG
ncbi:hypothetical protein MSPP1_003707 [Malassezia sp. CBS 17886]|nr:hypothetical protein MSPP1_003707 [Malassezia sp. CBS 17886]